MVGKKTETIISLRREQITMLLLLLKQYCVEVLPKEKLMVSIKDKKMKMTIKNQYACQSLVDCCEAA